VKTDFPDLLKKLAAADVDFVVVGGFAGVVYGCTCVTQDLDICCDFSADNLLRLQKALLGLNPVHRMTPSRKKLELTKDNCASLKNLYLDTDIGQLDCLSFINGVGDFQTVKQKSMLIKADDIRLPVLNLDALIETKKAMDRPRDKEALLQLQAIKKLKSQKHS
jgi:hypothetical protein